MAAADRLVGSTLHETYRVLRVIGKGGMGDIYEAEHVRLTGKRCAVKVLHSSFAENQEALARFRREAEIASALGHDHIVEVHDFNVQGELAYMVMELLDGQDLSQRLAARGPMSLDQVLRLVAETAAALAAAHAAHIVHRDLKPQNIFLCRRAGRDDWVKVLDFGTSKVLDSRTVVTQDNVLVGTPYYMSPEQASGRVHEIDSRTDVFALGAIVWELLAGSPAFESPSFSTALYRVSFVDPPDIHTLRPDVPVAVSLVLRRALAKSREHRTPSVDAFYTELLEGARGVEPADIPPPAPVGPDGMPVLPMQGAGAAPASPPSTPPARHPSTPPHSVTPAPKGFAPAPRPFTPAPEGFAPAPQPFTPAPEGFAPAPHASTPAPHAFTPGPPVSARPRRWPRLLTFAIVMAAAVAAGFAIVMVVHPGRPAPPVPAAPAAPTPAPESDPSPPPAPESRPADVSLTVRVSPPSARATIRVGGAAIRGNTTRVARGDKIEVVVEAPGYLPHREQVTPESDLVLAIALQKRRARRTARPTVKPAEPPQRVEPSPVEAPPAPVAQPAPSPAPKPRPPAAPAPQPEKKKRKTGTVFDD